jgi:signal transduction histidine kinase
MEAEFADDLSAIARIESVQKILEVVCRMTGLGFSAVARVTETRWIACAVRDEIQFGLLPGGELEVGTTICDAIRQNNEPVVIDHVAEDQEYSDHPTPKKYGFQSYASFPILLQDGRFFGTLCAIDPRPAKLKTPEIIGMFKLFADLIGMHLDSQDRMAASEAALLSEREAAKLREQFIAVLGHDLRNPLGAIRSGVDVLRMTPRSDDDRKMLDIIQRSAQRMAGLINDVMDFARARLGGGLSVARASEADLTAVLRQVVAELQTAWPTRTIQSQIDISRTVACSSSRIAQMLSNLIANALTHGDPDSPVKVHARTSAGALEISVGNRGETIPPDVVDRLFHPFVRGAVKPGQQGLGLGLYIASEIARAHGGVIELTSVNGKNYFTFRMPVDKQ